MTDARRRGQFHVCTICGAEFMFAETMWRHFYGELNGFRQDAQRFRAAYEARRQRERARLGIPDRAGRGWG